MTHTHVVTEKVVVGDQIIGGENSFTNEGRISIAPSIPGPSAQKEVEFAVTVARVKSIIISADQDLTIETNSTQAPGNSIALKANKPYVWHTDSYNALLLTVDVTKLFVTSVAIVAATLYVDVIHDVTP